MCIAQKSVKVRNKEYTIVKELPPSYHTYTWEGISYLKRTDWFLMNYDGEMVTEPQIKEGITIVEWLLPDEISKIKSSAWLSLMDLINSSIMPALRPPLLVIL